MVRRQNTTRNINHIKALTEKALGSVDAAYWKKCCGKNPTHLPSFETIELKKTQLNSFESHCENILYKDCRNLLLEC